MMKMTRMGALAGVICLSALCLSADITPRPVHKNSAERIEALEAQNIELRKQIAELNQKIEILTSRVNESCGGGRSFGAENITTGPAPSVPGLSVVRLQPNGSASAGAPAAPPARGKGRLIVTSSNEESALLVEHGAPLPGTNYVPLPDPAGPPAPSAEPKPAGTMAMAENAAAPSPPANEAAAFKQIKELLGSGKTDEAVPLMEDYLKRHARGAHEDEVAYRLGDYLFSQGEYARAIPVLRQVTENHPESSWAPDALYKVGLSYLELDKTSEAESALQEVGILYPFSEAAGKAAKKLEACCR